MKSNRKNNVIERKPRPFSSPSIVLLPVTLGSYPILGRYCPKKEGTRNRSWELLPGILLHHFPSPLHVPSLTTAAILHLTLCFPTANITQLFGGTAGPSRASEAHTLFPLHHAASWLTPKPSHLVLAVLFGKTMQMKWELLFYPFLPLT